MVALSSPHFTAFCIGSQPIQVTHDAGALVADTGLLTVRSLDLSLQVLDAVAPRLPDTRSPQYTRYSTRDILTQSVYQVLAGYPDANDADNLRTDPLFLLVQDRCPGADTTAASRSTLTRFPYAYTRRQPQAGQDPDTVLAQVELARCQRLVVLNDYLPELFVRTRSTPPAEIILDVDATDDPVHGKQSLSGYHGYYRQHQYLPLLVFEGHTGFPLAAWLRPGTAHASWGAVDTLERVVAVLRRAWPQTRILVRADNGFAVPEVYRFCEGHGLDYVLGYASNAVLERKVATAMADVELYWRCYGWRSTEPVVQRYEEIRDYQAGTWDRPRRVVAKIERHAQGGQQRFVVTNRPEAAEVVYRELYLPRGGVPEHPIAELKSGLRCDRLSAGSFRANAYKLLVHVLAYALVVLWREACVGVPEVAKASVSTLRQRWWKVTAVVEVRQRRIQVRVSADWPGWSVWMQVQAAIGAYVRQRPGGGVPAEVVM